MTVYVVHKENKHTGYIFQVGIFSTRINAECFIMQQPKIHHKYSVHEYTLQEYEVL